MNKKIKYVLAATAAFGVIGAIGNAIKPRDGAAQNNVPEAAKAKTATPSVTFDPQGVSFAKRLYTDEIVNAVLGNETIITIDQALKSTGIDLMVSADTYAGDYEANEIAADNKYKGKTILLTGKIDSINKGITGKGYLTLRAKGALLGMQAHLSSDGTEGAASLSKGTLVYLVCEPGPKIGPVSTTKSCQRFSQHMTSLAASIEKRIDRFFAGEISLPRSEAQSLIGGYVLGSRLPKDSPCLSDLDKCEREIEKLTGNKATGTELQAESEKLAQVLKIE